MKKTIITISVVLMALALAACSSTEQTRYSRQDERREAIAQESDVRGRMGMRVEEVQPNQPSGRFYENQPNRREPSQPMGGFQKSNQPLQGNDDFHNLLPQAVHEALDEAMAQAVGLSYEEFEARTQSGEHFMDIALEMGYSFEAARNLMTETRARVLSDAVAQGLLTQQQADAINSMPTGGNANAARGMRGNSSNNAWLAEKLGISVEELQARLDAGETLAEIAQSLGVELPMQQSGGSRPSGRGRYGQSGSL